MNVSIAIDGPAGAGKSTMAKRVAEMLGYFYVDTGALYRTVGLHVMRNGVSPADEVSIKKLLRDLDISFYYAQDGTQRMSLNGEDVSDAIRTPDISHYASAVSALASVRAFLLDMQRNMANKHSVVMDGRDIGTIVLPNASVKLFLTAKAEERARRRWKELREKGGEYDYETVLTDLIGRDKADSERPIAPLKAAQDAVVLDTTDLDPEATLSEILRIIKERTG